MNDKTKTQLRREWRAGWRGYTSFALGRRPARSRRERRSEWRAEWKERNRPSAEETPPEDS